MLLDIALRGPHVGRLAGTTAPRLAAAGHAAIAIAAGITAVAFIAIVTTEGRDWQYSMKLNRDLGRDLLSRRYRWL
jgi:hypothetical protein